MAGLEEVAAVLPSKSSLVNFGITTFHVITLFILFVIFALVAGVGLFFWLRWLKFNKKIVIWEKVGNNWEIVGRDNAMELKYNKMGDTVFFLRKRRKYLPRPEIQTGRKTYWFAIREDGEWINIGMKDINLEMKEAGVKYLHPGMAYARSGLYRVMRDSYDKPKFLEKYGVMLINIAAIAIILVFVYLIVDKILQAQDKAMQTQGMVNEGSQKTLDMANKVLAALDNIQSNSGMKPVPIAGSAG